MRHRSSVLESLGGEAGCERLSAQFYARVAQDPVLRPLFPGKTLRCAIEEFAAFLVQFLGGDEEHTQHRWWVSLRESHARFKISSAQRAAWLKNMQAALAAAPLDESTRQAMREFFGHTSAYVVGDQAPPPGDGELAERWAEQLALDNTIAAIVMGRDRDAIAGASGFAPRPSVFAGLLARMMQSGREPLIAFVVDAVTGDASLAVRRYGGRSLLHYAAGVGCLEVVAASLRHGVDPNIQDAGKHTPLYRVANQCSAPAGPAIVRALIQAGAQVNACDGVTRATPLHMAARRGNVGIARALLDAGAAIDAVDKKGDTPLRRAINCRKDSVVRLLRDRGAEH